MNYLLGHYIKKLHFQMEQCMNRKVHSLDLTPAQSHIIGFLTHSKQAPCARDLEAAFNLSHATVSGLLSRMENKGFIEIVSDPRDRRVKRIYLKEKGVACSNETRAHIDEMESQITAGFSEEEKQLFLSLMLRAIENLSHTNQENQKTERRDQSNDQSIGPEYPGIQVGIDP